MTSPSLFDMNTRTISDSLEISSLDSGLPSLHGPLTTVQDLNQSWENDLFPETILSQGLESEDCPIVSGVPCPRPPVWTGANYATSLPPATDYVGELSFQLHFQGSSLAKCATHTYSADLKKLYCQPSRSCPVDIVVDHPRPLVGIIRIAAVYKSLEHRASPVHCCPVHENSPQNNNGPTLRNHLIRVEGCLYASYTEDGETLHHSVQVPYEHPQAGLNNTTLLLNYMCHSSCRGGMNRRPVLTVVTLETPEGQLLGRRCFEVRVCASPGRDRKSDEDSLRKKRLQEAGDRASHSRTNRHKSDVKDSLLVPLEEASKCNCSNGEELFMLEVRGRGRFEMLKKINEGLELMDKLPQADRDEYRLERCPECSCKCESQKLERKKKKGKKEKSDPE